MWPKTRTIKTKKVNPFSGMGEDFAQVKLIATEIEAFVGQEEAGWSFQSALEASRNMEDPVEHISVSVRSAELPTTIKVKDDRLNALLARQKESMNLLDILGVTQDCSDEELKKAYRKFGLSFHPDKGGDGTFFAEIDSAYESLLNERSPDSDEKNEPQVDSVVSKEEDSLKLKANFTNPKLVTKNTHIAFFFDNDFNLRCKTSRGEFAINDSDFLNAITDSELRTGFLERLRFFYILRNDLQRECEKTPDMSNQYIKIANNFLLKKLSGSDKSIIVTVAISKGFFSLDDLRKVNSMVRTTELAQAYQKAVAYLITNKYGEEVVKQSMQASPEESENLSTPADTQEDAPLERTTGESSLRSSPVAIDEFNSNSPNHQKAEPLVSMSSFSIIEKFEDFFSDENAKKAIQRLKDQSLRDTLIQRYTECANNPMTTLTMDEMRYLAVGLSQNEYFEALKDVAQEMFKNNRVVLMNFLKDPVCCYWTFLPRNAGITSSRVAKAGSATSSYSRRKNLFEVAIQAHPFSSEEIKEIDAQRSKHKEILISTPASKGKIGKIKIEHLSEVFAEITKIITSSTTETQSPPKASSIFRSPSQKSSSHQSTSSPATPIVMRSFVSPKRKSILEIAQDM